METRVFWVLIGQKVECSIDFTRVFHSLLFLDQGDFTPVPVFLGHSPQLLQGDAAVRGSLPLRSSHAYYRRWLQSTINTHNIVDCNQGFGYGYGFASKYESRSKYRHGYGYGGESRQESNINPLRTELRRSTWVPHIL